MVEKLINEGAVKSRVQFIRDLPADDDFFNTHTRVAQAIVGAIEDNPDIKVIGLLGRWGSGKSTVANKIVEFLGARKDSGFRTFTYDAWLHQSDPLRRSFLESLIGSLVETKTIAPVKWSKELRKLSAPVEDTRTIETPELSHDARLIGLSLLVVPVGLGLVDLETLKEAFGTSRTALGGWALFAASVMIAAPVLTWLGLYLKRRPWKQLADPIEGVRTRRFWRLIDEKGEEGSVFHIFAEVPAKSTKTQTFRSIEPTSLEFGRMFQDIVREASAGGHRLIILIDNLDRVAEEEALGMWATIRSFFLASQETEEVKHEPFHPTVILPIDRHAVEELFAGAEAGQRSGRDRAKSFMDKTFDVTFEVPEPVTSDWRDFLVQQMKGMFGEGYQPAWGFWTRRLFESQVARQQTIATPDDGKPPAIVTPREINKLLNRVGTLYLQWADEGIPVEVMALYVIRRDDIEREVLSFLQSEEVEIASVCPQWKNQLAALHYGVAVDKAAQVLLEDPIRSAILRRDEAAIKKLSIIPGFGEIFEYATANLPGPTGSRTPFDVVTNAVLLLQSLDPAGDEWFANAWRNLVSRYNETGKTGAPTRSAAELIKLLTKHVAADRRGPFVSTSAYVLSHLLAQPRKSAADDLPLRVAAQNLIAFASTHNLPVPAFDLKIDPQQFVTRLSELSGASTLWPRLRTEHDGDAIGEALSNMLSANAVQRMVPNAIRCFILKGGEDIYAGDNAIDFESLAEAAKELVSSPGSLGGDAIPGIRVLAELSFGGHTEGRDLLISLVDQGILATRLNEATEKSDWEGVSVIIAILMWRGKKFDPPGGRSWYQFARDISDYSEKIVEAIQKYFPGSIVPILWGSEKASYLQSSFVEGIIGWAVENDALGKFDATKILANLHEYKRVVPYRLRDRFLEQVDKQSGLLESLEAAPLGPPMVEAVEYLKRKGGQAAERAATIMRTRVEQADASAWSAAINSGVEPYGLGLSFLKNGDMTFGRKSGLYEALHSEISNMTLNASRDARLRWFSLVDLVTSRHRKALLQALAGAMAKASPVQALHILKTGGVQFLKTGGFSGRADDSVRTIILPQLDKKEGRDWLKDNRDELASWVARAELNLREKVSQKLTDLLSSKLESRRYIADILITAWKLRSNN